MGQEQPPPQGLLAALQRRLQRIYQRAQRLFGVGCVTVAWILIIWTHYVYLTRILPLLIDLRSYGIFFFVPGSWLSFNAVFNYAMVLLTSPGKPIDTLTTEELKALQEEQAPEKGKGWTKFCKKCQVPKPPRTHHCNTCGHCILKMDHHCPWINGCIGHFNHRYFMNFLLHLALLCSFSCTTLGLYFMGFLESPLGEDGSAVTGSIIFTSFMSFAILVITSMFIAWNCYLLFTNQTTIEYHYNRGMEEQARVLQKPYVNPYDVGLRRNLYQVFGAFRSWWQLSLPSSSRLPTDGTRWLTVSDPFDDIR
eukprot:GGOE01013700.1.p1 GENE.GGOE01013700.1~~GGOE01013700.1.p1  ORF type:complete len:320 (+),score=89.54 GGOE01013700.1:39-962(+)